MNECKVIPFKEPEAKKAFDVPCANVAKLIDFFESLSDEELREIPAVYTAEITTRRWNGPRGSR